MVALLAGGAAQAGAGRAPPGGGRPRLDLAGLIQLPTETWDDLRPRLYTAETARSPAVMWRTNWTPAGDRFVNPSLDQVQMDARPYGQTRARVVMDGPTSPTALGYDPFSVVLRPGGEKALRITPRFVPPDQRDKSFGYPIVSGVLSTAGRNVEGARTEFYASTFSVTVYRKVRLPRRMWTEIWQYPRDNYGSRSAAELDVLETMRGLWPQKLWLTAHSDDAAWRQAIVQDPRTYDPRLTRWAGERAVGLQYTGLAASSASDLHDFALVKSPKVIQWAVDGDIVLTLPTPKDVAAKLMHDIIDVSYGMELPEPRSDADLDALEIGPIERYVFPGLSRVVWLQQPAGDGSGVPGARRRPGTPSSDWI